MSDAYAMHVLKIAVAQICQTIGWHSTHTTTMELLVDVTQHFLREISRIMHRYSELYNRTEPNLDDLALAYRDIGINLPEMLEYIEFVDPIPLSLDVPRFPVPKETNLCFLKPGSKEVLTRPMHIPEYLPPMLIEAPTSESGDLGEEGTEHGTDDGTGGIEADANGMIKSVVALVSTSGSGATTTALPASIEDGSLLPESIVNEEIEIPMETLEAKKPKQEPLAAESLDAEATSAAAPITSDTSGLATVAQMPAPPPPASVFGATTAARPPTASEEGSTSEAAADHKASATNKPNQSTVAPMEDGGEGRPTREISSVMMTTSGFISPAREGKLPDTRIPLIPEDRPPKPTIPQHQQSPLAAGGTAGQSPASTAAAVGGGSGTGNSTPLPGAAKADASPAQLLLAGTNSKPPLAENDSNTPSAHSLPLDQPSGKKTRKKTLDKQRKKSSKKGHTGLQSPFQSTTTGAQHKQSRISDDSTNVIVLDRSSRDAEHSIGPTPAGTNVTEVGMGPCAPLPTVATKPTPMTTARSSKANKESIRGGIKKRKPSKESDGVIRKASNTKSARHQLELLGAHPTFASDQSKDKVSKRRAKMSKKVFLARSQSNPPGQGGSDGPPPESAPPLIRPVGFSTEPTTRYVDVEDLYKEQRGYMSGHFPVEGAPPTMFPPKPDPGVGSNEPLSGESTVPGRSESAAEQQAKQLSMLQLLHPSLEITPSPSSVTSLKPGSDMAPAAPRKTIKAKRTHTQSLVARDTPDRDVIVIDDEQSPPHQQQQPTPLISHSFAGATGGGGKKQRKQQQQQQQQQAPVGFIEQSVEQSGGLGSLPSPGANRNPFAELSAGPPAQQKKPKRTKQQKLPKGGGITGEGKRSKGLASGSPPVSPSFRSGSPSADPASASANVMGDPVGHYTRDDPTLPPMQPMSMPYSDSASPARSPRNPNPFAFYTGMPRFPDPAFLYGRFLNPTEVPPALRPPIPFGFGMLPSGPGLIPEHGMFPSPLTQLATGGRGYPLPTNPFSFPSMDRLNELNLLRRPPVGSASGTAGLGSGPGGASLASHGSHGNLMKPDRFDDTLDPETLLAQTPLDLQKSTCNVAPLMPPSLQLFPSVEEAPETSGSKSKAQLMDNKAEALTSTSTAATSGPLEQQSALSEGVKNVPMETVSSRGRKDSDQVVILPAASVLPGASPPQRSQMLVIDIDDSDGSQSTTATGAGKDSDGKEGKRKSKEHKKDRKVKGELGGSAKLKKKKDKKDKNKSKEREREQLQELTAGTASSSGMMTMGMIGAEEALLVQLRKERKEKKEKRKDKGKKEKRKDRERLTGEGAGQGVGSLAGSSDIPASTDHSPSCSVPKLMLKLSGSNATPSPRSDTPEKAQGAEMGHLSALTVATGDGTNRGGSPELARISALVTRPPKLKPTGTGTGAGGKGGKEESPVKGASDDVDGKTDVDELIPGAGSSKQIGGASVGSGTSPAGNISSTVVGSARAKGSGIESLIPLSGEGSRKSAKDGKSDRKGGAAHSGIPVTAAPLSSGGSCQPAAPAQMTDVDGNTVWICPACGRVDDGTPMIGCDGCDAWYHWICVGIEVAPDENEDWYCRVCIGRKQDALKDEKQRKRKKKDKNKAKD
ncbi:nascent polypeptide-associated complex subunit alpha, muscle-specific form isoform X1 [Anopheles darlingi]|uniref:nascent polypeptide-associated complex subunit alpha, muscle-specific form isoform X1 n=1 Tax=Anopheles darlingi TaxID=43151 RepID=UPI002100588C|nr:nascent polypeptide-associated complex subunit alpha, muscle-specific form isoform X1 [Anopheles darlingi]XP_049541419.1 nascent polypeptide-associated complex subunit alpha, muscle-specific form isoform X1 [Anopheles darlingi]